MTNPDACLCGVIPAIKTKTENCGHGMNLSASWVECECGLRGPEISEYDYPHEALRKIKAINKWDNILRNNND